MIRNTLMLSGLWLGLMVGPMFAAAPTSQPAAVELHVAGHTLALPSGERFVVKGVNLELFRDRGDRSVTAEEYPQRDAIVAKMKSLGINAVRVNYSYGWVEEKPENLQQLLDFMKTLARSGIYVMPSDHSFTGKNLKNRAKAYPLFAAIVDGANKRGIASYLLLNPYNEPGPGQAKVWVADSKDTLLYLRKTANFTGVVVLDTLSWATDSNAVAMTEVCEYDATLLHGKANVVFSNHWYPNNAPEKLTAALANAATLPLLVGEIGRINPGVTKVENQFAINTLETIVTKGIPNGHNGVFAWIWYWSDENSMTDGDYLTLNEFGNLIVQSYYARVSATGVITATPATLPAGK